MKKISMAGMAWVAIVFGSFAEQVAPNVVASAVNNWIGQRAQMGCSVDGTVSSVRLCTAPNGAAFYVAKLSGGGFVVTSTDTEIDPIIAFSPSADLAEVATFKLFFNPQGGTCGETARRVTCGDEIGKLPVPVRNGWKFDGWYTAVMGGVKVGPATLMVGFDVDLYAHWQYLR